MQQERQRAAHAIAVRKIQAKAFQAQRARAQRVATAQDAYERARIAAQIASSPQALMAARDRLAAAQGALNSIWNDVPPAGVPQVGMGQVSTAPVAVVGRDSSRYEAGGAVRVSARWAQRAANAGLRYNNPFAARIVVDGRAGPITISTLRNHSHQFSSDQPVTNDPPTSRITDRVIIPVALEARLATLPFVPDPPASSATHTTTPSTSATTPPVTVPIPGATPASPADAVILDEGSSGGLVARYGIWPFVIGGTALAGLGVWFLMGGGSRMRANRITPRQRARLPKKAFVFPGRRAWPIDNARRAYAAIQFLRMGRVRSASDFNEIRNVVRRRFPDVWAIYGKNLTWDRAKAAKARRTSRRRSTRGAARRMVANA
jgi:hypothetical protein